MKKFLALIMAVVMVLSCAAALADEVVLDRSAVDRNFADGWAGEWKLVAAVIGEDFADENDIETTGIIEIADGTMTLTVEALMDAAATGSSAGVMVDQAAYTHAHVNDVKATATTASGDTIDFYCPWDGWLVTVNGEDDVTYASGIGKLSKGKNHMFSEITGVESDVFEDENMKYIGLTEDGRLVICYSDDNLVKKDGEIGFGYIFVKAE